MIFHSIHNYVWIWLWSKKTLADQNVNNNVTDTVTRQMWFAGMQVQRNMFFMMTFCVISTVLMYVLFTQFNNGFENFQRQTVATFVSALAAWADEDRYVMLIMADVGFIDMAINFYEASLRAHDVDNFLFVGIGREICQIFKNMSVPCFHYVNDSTSGKSSTFGERNFFRKMNYRTDMILEALEANFTVIHTDADVAFLDNPVKDMKVIVSDLYRNM